ncbi:MAG: hypothetical protein JNL21_23470 [Myxococcales bacterium]|nr:hypothetical protein [Myxococcales bacterium]
MARRFVLFSLVLVPFGCELEERDPPPPFESGVTVGVAAGGIVATTGSGGAGGAGTTSSSTTGTGGSSSSGLGAALTPYCGCAQSFVEGTTPACSTCIEDSQTLACLDEWEACLASTLCQNIVMELTNCIVPYDQDCIDAAVLVNGPGVSVLANFFQCACEDTCGAECPAEACQ